MINPSKFYTPPEIAELGQQGFFPIKNAATVRKLIEIGKLKASNMSSGKKPQWQVKGEDLLAALETAGSFEIKRNPNVKSKRGKKKAKDEKSLSQAEGKLQS